MKKGTDTFGGKKTRSVHYAFPESRRLVFSAVLQHLDNKGSATAAQVQKYWTDLLSEFPEELEELRKKELTEIPSDMVRTLLQDINTVFVKQAGHMQKINDGYVAATQSTIREASKSFDDDCIFNFDETAYFYHVSPGKKVGKKHFKGLPLEEKKKFLTMALLVNKTGTIKKLSFVGDRTNHRDGFHELRLKKNFGYDPDEYSWMNREIFLKMLKLLDEQAREEGKKYLLTLDAFSAHMLFVQHGEDAKRFILNEDYAKYVFELTSSRVDYFLLKGKDVPLIFIPKNVKLVYFLPGTSPVCQPLVAGLFDLIKIRASTWRIEISMAREDSIEGSRNFKTKLKEAIESVLWAVESLDPETISLFFHKCGYYEDNEEHQDLTAEALQAATSELTEVLKPYYEDFSEEEVERKVSCFFDEVLETPVLSKEIFIESEGGAGFSEELKRAIELHRRKMGGKIEKERKTRSFALFKENGDPNFSLDIYALVVKWFTSVHESDLRTDEVLEGFKCDPTKLNAVVHGMRRLEDAIDRSG